MDSEMYKLQWGQSTSSENLASEDYQAELYATFVPDEVVYSVESEASKTDMMFTGAVLMGDISGFTELCDRYSKYHSEGISKLTSVINSYLGSIVNEILRNKGDVMKYSGDAFLAVWKKVPGITMQDIMHQVLDTCLLIRGHYGIYSTDIGVTLKIKLSVAAGECYFSMIGIADSKHYIIIGNPVKEVKAGERICSSGEVMVAESGFNFVQNRFFKFEEFEDNTFKKLLGLGPAWNNTHQIRLFGLNYKDVGALITEHYHNKHTTGPETSSDTTTRSFSTSSSFVSSEETEYIIRPTVKEASNMKLKVKLLPYIFRPVVKAVDNLEPLKYLTEMRQVVIMFVNIIQKADVSMLDLIKLADESYQIMYKHITQYHGCLNKMIMFDKDIMFLCIFGLTGFKRHLESQAALRCAATLYKTLLNFLNIETVSIAVTTGIAYCGVIGHDMRQEYTVIGSTVNKAARLMVVFPSQITCDKESFLHSRLQTFYFEQQSHKELKGIKDCGPVYKFKTSNGSSMALEHSESLPPLIGRELEMTQFYRCLSIVINSKATKSDPSIQKIILIRGESRQGKTHIVRGMVANAQKKYPVVCHYIPLTKISWMMPYGLGHHIFGCISGRGVDATPQERRLFIMSKMEKLKSKAYLCALNDVLNTDFPKTQTFKQMTVAQQEYTAQKMLSRVLLFCLTKVNVIAIDNIEFADKESWQLLRLMLEINKIFFLITLGPHRELDKEAYDILNSSRVKTLELPGLCRWHQIEYTCSVLEVQAMPAELERVIHKQSKGNPGWIEIFVLSHLQSGVLKVIDSTTDAIPEYGLVTVQHTRDDAIDISLFDITKQVRPELEGMKDIKICVIAPGHQLKEDDGITLDAMMMQKIDSLPAFAKYILKVASILGDVFERNMLLGIMLRPDIRRVAEAIVLLFEEEILCCAKGDFTMGYGAIPMMDVPVLDRAHACSCKGITIPGTQPSIPFLEMPTAPIRCYQTTSLEGQFKKGDTMVSSLTRVATQPPHSEQMSTRHALYYPWTFGRAAIYRDFKRNSSQVIPHE